MKANELTTDECLTAVCDPKTIFAALATGQSLTEFRDMSVDAMLSGLSEQSRAVAKPIFEGCINDGIQDALLIMIEGLPISSCSERLFESNSNGFKNFIKMSSIMLAKSR